MPKVHILPLLPRGEDPGDGGIRQVVKAQHEHLAASGWEVEPDPALADVIACHVEVPATYLRNWGHKPIVIHNHGAYWSPDYEWVRWSYAANAKVIESLRVADITTAVSHWTAQTLRRHSNRDVRVVHHGVDLAEWTPRDEPGDYVLWNKTRIDPVCDPRPMLAVAAEMPDVPFVSTFGLDDVRLQNLQVLGKMPYEQSKEWVRRAGVYLCTTRETFGIGTLEALACGVPVVGYIFGGQAEIIEHGVDGWLVPEGDIAGLQEGIRWALGNADARAAARAKAEQFPVARSIEQYAAIYDEVLERYTRERPKVSVIVTAYRLEAYLRDTLDSVQAQEEVDWECIVVDDASPDDCGAIADAYAAADPRFRVVHNEQNVYLAQARNIGIEASRGDYIMPLDGDDMLPPGALAVLAGALDRYRGLDIAYGNVLFVDEDGRTPTNYGERFPLGHSGWPVDFRLDWMLQQQGQPMPYASMYRRRVWELTGGYRRRARSSEDCDMWLRATSYGFMPAMVTQGDMLVYRNRADSMSREQGWEDHRGWFPWTHDWSILPAAAHRGQGVRPEEIAFQSWDPAVIAVVIPVGPGHGRWVIDAVDSVDAQTFRQWECIVVNDSGEPLPRLPQWVRVVEPEPEEAGGGLMERGRFGSVAAARNAGIAASRAPLFLPLDADDYLQPQALQVMLDAHMDDPEHRPIVYTDFWDEKAPGEATVFECPDYDARIWVRHGLGRAVTALTRRVYWERVGGYDETVAWEDWLFALRCAEQGFCERRVPFPLLNYRKYTGSRADEMYANFDDSRASIMAQDFKLVGGELMACGSCPGGRSTTYTGFSLAQERRGAPAAPAPEGSVMVEYIGRKAGDVHVRSSVSGQQRYTFSLSSPKRWVWEQDVEFFEHNRDYRVLGAAEAATPVPTRSSAVLVAAGPPRNEPAGTNGFAGLKSFPTEVPPPAEDVPRSPATGNPLGTDTEDVPTGIAAMVSAEPQTGPLGMPEPVMPPAPSAPPPALAGRPQVAVEGQVVEVDELTAARMDAEERRRASPLLGPDTDARVKALARETREDLDARARALGIQNPEDLENKTSVARSIIAAEEMRRA